MADSAHSTMALTLDGITLRLGGLTVVDNLSFTVRQGEFVTLLGPSGCGKSSTLRVIAGYLLPDKGEVFIGEERVTEIAPQARNIGMVFQNYALFPHLTVARNIAFALSVRRRPAKEIATRVAEMLRLVRLEGLGGRLPTQLSGGQQQRVALARVLAFKPSLLLLDEPLSALDLKLREEMQAEIKRIQRELAITTIYVTHDQGEALYLSDRIAVMRAGGLEQLGTPSEVYRRPKTKFVASFLGRMQFLPARAAGFADNRQIIQLSGCDVRLAYVSEHPMQPGETCTIGIRPERVQLVEADGGAPRKWVLSGTVSECQYLGTHALVTVLTALEQPIFVVDYNHRSALGRRVALTWDESDMVVFPDSSVPSRSTERPDTAPASKTEIRRANAKWREE